MEAGISEPNVATRNRGILIFEGCYKTNMAEQKENELGEAAAISSYLKRTKLFLEIKKDLRVGIFSSNNLDHVLNQFGRDVVTVKSKLLSSIYRVG